MVAEAKQALAGGDVKCASATYCANVKDYIPAWLSPLYGLYVIDGAHNELANPMESRNEPIVCSMRVRLCH